MKGCSKSKTNCEWMKEMLHWDLFTHPKADSFAQKTPNEEKVNLALQWKNFMEAEDTFISFYEWKNKKTILPNICSTKVLEPKKVNPICCPIQTLSISDLGKEIGRLKKTIKEQKSITEHKEEQKTKFSKYNIKNFMS
jgi:hypothetical protein